MRSIARVLTVSAVVLGTHAYVALDPLPASANGPGCRNCAVTGGGAAVGLSRPEAASLPPKKKATFVEAGKKVTKEVPYQ